MKLCAVGMRSAKLGNDLNVLMLILSGGFKAVWYFEGKTVPPNTKSKYTKLCLLSDELIGVVAMVVVIPVSRVPVMAVTLKSPNPPLSTAPRSIERTSLSLTVELNFRARSTITLPHLGRKMEY